MWVREGERGLALKHTNLAALTVHFLRLLPRGALGGVREGERGLALKHTNLAALPVHYLLRLLLLAMCSSTAG